MSHQHPTPIQNLVFSLTLLLSVLLACTTPPPNPPAQNFNFAVSVRDRDRQKMIGQATVLVEVGNLTVAQEVTDDNGQANFNVSSDYLGKSVRLFAKAHGYYNADLVLVLRNDARQTIPLVSTDFPKLDPEPAEPKSAPGVAPSQSPKPKDPPPNLESFAEGESKSGMIADQQVIDYRFEANKNAPLIFKARIVSGNMHFSLEIYDSQGFPQKNLYVSYTDEIALPFTPPQTGTYILRLRGRKNFGTYLVSMQRL